MSCIFCKIVDGEIPSYKVYEDDLVIAFLDISQTTFGHTLVIPKAHFENIFEISNDVFMHLMNVVQILSSKIKSELNCTGVNIVNNNGESAGQTVFHYHAHIIPRYDENDGYAQSFSNNINNYTNDEIKELHLKLLKK